MLTLVEEILLLTLEDAGGDFADLPEYTTGLALGGAVLMELALRDRVDSDLSKLMVVDTEPTGDDILDAALRDLGDSREPPSVRQALWKLAQSESIRDRTLNRLVERGVLRREEKKVFWVFGSRRYPVVDDTEQREAKLRIRSILLNDDIPEPRDVVLICLARACALLPSVLDGAELESAAARIERVSRMDLIGREMLRDLTEMVETPDPGWWGIDSAGPDPEFEAEDG